MRAFRPTYLANRKEFNELFFGNPVALFHQVIAQNGHVGLWTTKGDESQWPKGCKDLVYVQLVTHTNAQSK